MDAEPVRLDIYRTAIPMRDFEHAAASRSVAEAIVVRLGYSDGRVGWGETLPREYVTDETLESVADDLAERIWPVFVEGCSRWAGLGDPERIEEIIPSRAAGGRCMNAAACAMDLAAAVVISADEFSRVARRRVPARVTGVLGSAAPGRTAKRLRLMRWFGLRDFKLKLGFGDDVDAENLRVVHRRIAKALARGRCTLRVDVNGGWDADLTPQRVAELRQYNVCAVEQPVFCPAGELVELARRCELPLIADESLLTRDDAETLLADTDGVWWNVRISKNGGLTRARALAELAAERGATFILGCMVGESGLLSSAQRRLMQLGAEPRFVEGNYGGFLLRDDLTSPSPRFGYGGRLKPLKGPGLGVRVDPRKLERYGTLVGTLGV